VLAEYDDDAVTFENVVNAGAFGSHESLYKISIQGENKHATQTYKLYNRHKLSIRATIEVLCTDQSIVLL
jgi:hypothetical protein